MEGKYTKETLALINQRFCNDHVIMDSDVKMANAYVELIESSRSQKRPKIGDRIRYTNEYGEYFPKGHIDRVEGNETYICESPYVPFVWKNRGNNGIQCSTSGGAWCYIPLSDLTYVGAEFKSFCDWGSCGACKDGAIEFDAAVSVWEYKKEPLKGINHTTETHNRMFVNYYEDMDTGYKFHGKGIAWRTELEFQAWLRTVRAEISNWGKDKIIVWYWKEKQFHVSPTEYEKINGIEDTMTCNGCRKCKRIYDENNCIINTYFVWYWEDDSITDFSEKLSIQNKIRDELYTLPYPNKPNQHALEEIREYFVEPIDVMSVFREYH